MEISKKTSDLCTKIIETLGLSQKDRSSLSKKRGFSDEIIDLMMFRSSFKGIAGDNKYDFIDDDDLKQALTYDKIIIPFFDNSGRVTFFRPHHLAVKGYPSQIYVPYRFNPSMFIKPDRLVITEGEFKAVASCVMGVPAISVPGISSFVGAEKRTVLFDIIRHISPKEIVFCFDKEVKDDKSFPNYKPDYTKRYDTEYFSIVMAKYISKEMSMEGNVKIAALDSEWMVGGKIDIDGFLASGREHSLYKECLDAALTPKKYQYSLKIPRQHAAYINRRVDAQFYNGPIGRYFNSYTYTKPGSDKTYSITNFLMKISNSMQSKDEVVRMCQFVSDYGMSIPFELKAEHMASKQLFVKKCFSLGDFEFHGGDAELQALWTFVFKHQKNKSVYELDHFGYVDAVDAWLFENGSFCNKTGEFTPVDENGILWVEDIGYRLPQKRDTGIRPPSISAPVSGEKTIGFEELEGMFSSAMNSIDKDFGMNQSDWYPRMALSWVFANFFMPELLKDLGIDGFPILFIYGRFKSGKTTLASWLNCFFGSELSKGLTVASTKVGIENASGYYSMLPLWLDEFRNDNDAPKKINLFRSIYDRSSAAKGTSYLQGKVRQYPLRSSLMVSGEEFPNDAAMNSRCISIPMFSRRVGATDGFNWIKKHKLEFAKISANVLVNKQKSWPVIKSLIEKKIKYFASNDVDNRIAKNFAIISGVNDYFFKENAGFDSFLDKFVYDFEVSRNNESSIAVFIDDLTNGLINESMDCRFARAEENEGGTGNTYLYLNLKSAYSAWELSVKRVRADVPMKLEVIEGWLSSISAIDGVDKNNKILRKRIGGVQMRVIRIDMKSKELPTQFISLYEVVRVKQPNMDQPKHLKGNSFLSMSDLTEEA